MLVGDLIDMGPTGMSTLPLGIVLRWRRTLRVLACVALVGSTAACAEELYDKASFKPDPAHELKINEDFATKTFRISLTNKSRFSFCLEYVDWPDRGGISDGELVTVVDHGRSFSPPWSNPGYCPGGCGMVLVRPGETIQGWINFDAVPDPYLSAPNPDRRLTYKVPFVRCPEHPETLKIP